MRFVNIGFGNLAAEDRILAVVAPESAPTKRLVQEARDRGMLIDASYGRKTKAVLIMDTDHVILSAIATDLILARMEGRDEHPEFPLAQEETEHE